ncbi:MAG TPA: ABC transporter substrate-binding protein, partial [Methanotrichaceae archaeon]|nr:ABC transporter substrate-binding protein [Methanotrichaceae archaeon]
AVSKDDLPVVKSPVNKDCSGTPWFLGVQKGFFEKAGFLLDDVGQIAFTQQPAAFVSGQIDVYDNHPVGIINLIKAGAPIIAVAQGGDEPLDGDKSKMHMHWLVRDDSPLKTFADIGKQDQKVKIQIVASGVCSDVETNALLRKYKIPKDKIEYVILPDPEAIPALKQGLIDVAALHPPFFTAMEKEGGVRVIATSSEAFGQAAGQTLICFSKDFIKNHPDTVRKFIKGYKTAERWSNANRKESGEITAKTIGLKVATAHWYSDSGKVNETEIQAWIDAMVLDGDIKKGEFKPKDLYTDEFKDTW